MSNISLKGATTKASELFRLRDEYNKAKASATAIQKEATKIQEQLTDMLLDAKLTGINCSQGTFYLQTKQEYGVSDYNVFRQFLVEHNLVHMLTVSTNTLQTYCQKELEKNGTLPKGVITKGERISPLLRKGK